MSDSINFNAPSEFQLLPHGEIELEGEGTAFLDGPMMDHVISRFESRGNDMVIDYEHQTMHGGNAPAAGWIKRLVNRGKQGLWAVVTWTEKAKKYLENGEYRYFSPVFRARKSDGKVLNVLNVALTNSPKINRLNPIVAKNDNNDPELLETTLRLAKGFDLNEEDLKKYGEMDSDPDEIDNSAILTVAKLMGNTEEDIRGYGGMHLDYDSEESDEAKIGRLLGCNS